MQVRVINPYDKLGLKHNQSLDFIITNLPPNPAFDDVNNTLTAAFFTTDPNEPDITDGAEVIIKTMLPHAYNGYVNSQWSIVNSQQQDTGKQWTPDNGPWMKYNAQQLRLIGRMLAGIHSVPVEAIGDFLITMEEEIVAGQLNYEEQIPLLVATAIGRHDYAYWQAQIATPGAWSVYLNTDNAINYMHVAGWVSAAMQGALLTYGLVKPPQVQFIDIYTSVISSVGLVAGKVMWGWVGK